MKPKLCIVAYDSVINIAKQVASQFSDEAELNEKFERAEKSTDIAEISKQMAEIYRYAYDHYLMVPICEIPDMIAITKRIPKWNPGLRRMDRNYYDLVKQR